MKSLRVSFVFAGMLLLSASTLSAQAGRVSCKDGSLPKGGHFSCWGHGGIVTGAVKTAAKTDGTAAGKAEKRAKAPSKAKQTVAKGTKSTIPKADKKKAGKKPPARRATKNSAK
jgi:hypothetical protein